MWKYFLWKYQLQVFEKTDQNTLLFSSNSYFLSFVSDDFFILSFLSLHFLFAFFHKHLFFASVSLSYNQIRKSATITCNASLFVDKSNHEDQRAVSFYLVWVRRKKRTGQITHNHVPGALLTSLTMI